MNMTKAERALKDTRKDGWRRLSGCMSAWTAHLAKKCYISCWYCNMERTLGRKAS